MVKHYRVEVFRYEPKSKCFEKIVSSTPCDLGDQMKEIMFGGAGEDDDGSDQFNQVRRRIETSILLQRSAAVNNSPL